MIQSDDKKSIEKSEIEENKDEKDEMMEWIKSLAFAIIIAIIIKSFLIDSTRIDGLSMYPTLKNNDRLLVNKISTYFREPSRGEIIVFHAPDSDKDYIKRIIGIPGDLIEIQYGKVYVNGNLLTEDYIEKGVRTFTDESSVWEVPAEQYFVLGDNREPGQSKDSRYFGTIDRKSITSYAMIRYYPFNKIGSIY